MNLAAAIRDRSSGTSEIDINGETKLRVLADVWFDQVKGRDLSPSTVQAYRDRLDKQILPSLGSSGCESYQLEWSNGTSPRSRSRTAHHWPKPPAVFSLECLRLLADTTPLLPTRAATSAGSR